MSRTYTYLAALVGVVCVYFVVRLFFFIDLSSRTVPSDVVQGILIGFGLAFVTAQIYARVKATRVNGWITMFGLGLPSNGMLMRAACAQLFPGPVNVPQEAMYWWTNADGAGHALSGEHSYRMHFPAGQLPPNHAFWSLSMGTAKNHFVPNPIHRCSAGYTMEPGAADGTLCICVEPLYPAPSERLDFIVGADTSIEINAAVTELICPYLTIKYKTDAIKRALSIRGTALLKPAPSGAVSGLSCFAIWLERDFAPFRADGFGRQVAPQNPVA